MSDDLQRIWGPEGDGRRLSMVEHPNGDVSLIVATDCDDGPARSVRIPEEALAALSSKLLGLSWARAMAAAGRAMREALEPSRTAVLPCPRCRTPVTVDGLQAEECRGCGAEFLVRVDIRGRVIELKELAPCADPKPMASDGPSTTEAAPDGC